MKDLLSNNRVKNLVYILLGGFFIYEISYAIGKAIAHFIK